MQKLLEASTSLPHALPVADTFVATAGLAPGMHGRTFMEGCPPSTQFRPNAAFDNPVFRSVASPRLTLGGDGHSYQQNSAIAAMAYVLPWLAGVAGVAAGSRGQRRRLARRGRSSGLTKLASTNSKKDQVTVDSLEPAWRSFGEPWEIHKFGGASLNTAELYRTCGDLLLSESKGNEERDSRVPTAAVVSAAGGMTDALAGVMSACVVDLKAAEAQMNAAASRQKEIVLELVPGRPDLTDPVIKNIDEDTAGVSAMLTAASLLRGAPPQMMELVAGLGEVWSAQTLASYLQSVGVAAAWVDAREVLIVSDSASLAGLGEKGTAMDTIEPFWEKTSERLQQWWNSRVGLTVEGSGHDAPFLIITGFVCSTESGRPTTLKRSGSDYSATIFAKILGCSKVTMWKNVNGVYTADPRLVPAAFPIPRLTFDEAMELAYFGGQVLHPSAMVPCIEGRIPVFVRNVFNPSHPGTRVYGRGDARLRWEDQDEDETAGSRDMPVKAVTSIAKVTLITLSGTSFIGTPGVARRMMDALSTSGVNVILASQGSSEHSITVAVDERDGDAGTSSVRSAFELEIARNKETQVTKQEGCSIVAAIGEGMKENLNIAGRFLSALGKAKVNIVAIAQGSSERNISVVVQRADLSRALRATHAGFTLSDMTIAIGIIGTGKVGTELLRQLDDFVVNRERGSSTLAMQNVRKLNMVVRAVCDVNCMVLAEQGVPLRSFQDEEGSCTSGSGGVFCDIAKWDETARSHGSSLKDILVTASGTSDASVEVRGTNLGEMIDFLDTKDVPYKAVVDCTASEETAALYPDWLRRGLHVISVNNRGVSGPTSLYRASIEQQGSNRSGSGRWNYEATLGAQMPVISMIHDLLQTGDRVESIVGVFSGSLSFVSSALHMNPNMKFSEAVANALNQGLMEPDMYDDLAGHDTARKALIIARELGMNLELGDIVAECLLPEALQESRQKHLATVTQLEPEAFDLIAGLREHADEAMGLRMREASERGERLLYVAEVNPVAGSVHVGLRSFSPQDPFYTLQAAELGVKFATERYSSAAPLVVRGPGCGPVVTASAALADLLRLSTKFGN